ncbi:MAG: hypothetical protein KVP17_002565 [Porospora cf. gigantea B]|uniref:uncharacterized protein n=1 Tax=Porospora cf. gigantea B TaxID=2853592 RepID=UPI003571DDAB|nr:MAG: hypothetical protein KVP17_002565 [Porospora cf. gigantea B]
MSDTNPNSEVAEPTNTPSKELGNEAFAQDDYETAIKHWKDALRSVEYCLKKGLFDDCKDKQAEIDAMNLNLLSNICMGYLKLRVRSHLIFSILRLLSSVRVRTHSVPAVESMHRVWQQGSSC